MDALQAGDVVGDPPDTMETASTVTPQDYLNKAADENYCIEGAVGDSYDAVALLGFNINEDAATADCSYDPNAANTIGPPDFDIQETGIAVNIASNVTSATIRIQIQTAEGGLVENPDQRWCYDLGVTGAGASDGVKVFAPYSEFNSKCWEASYLDESEWTGEAYANQPISAVVFLVPGDAVATTPYNFCVLGFAEGNSEADAPDGFTVDLGDQEGDCGGPGGEDANYDRKMVSVDGENYIIQNNYWGSDTGSQTLHYINNSFEITQLSGSANGNAPVSFPSIYVGQNGNKALTTTSTDNLPAKISEITSAQSTFNWSGNLSDANATYDIWFASDNPPYGGNEYGDAVSGFAMLWLHKPGSRQPIGSDSGSDATFCGVTWDVWAGTRGQSPDYPDLSSNRPVISYVAQGDVQNFSCNLKDMMTDATTKNYNGQQLNSNWYLTDVFAGFEIWGGSPVGAKVTKFTIDVQK